MLNLQQIRELKSLISSDAVTVKGSQALLLVSLIAALEREEQTLLAQEAAHKNLQAKVSRIQPVEAVSEE